MRIRNVLLFVLALGLTAAAPSRQSDPVRQLYVLKQLKPDMESVGIVWNGRRSQSDIRPLIQRAGTSAGVRVVIAPAETRSDVSAAFRELVGNGVDAIWIVREDGLVDQEPSRSYLIREATRRGLPVLAPSTSWVNDGASVAVYEQGGQLQVSLNRPAVQALGMTVPASIASRVDYVAAR